MGVIFMAKYSNEFKLKIVMEYLGGDIGYRSLARKYHIPSDRRIRGWVAAYQAGGLEKISRSRQNQVYSFKFKLHAVQLYLSTETSYQDLAFSLGLKEPSVLAQWVSRYRSFGIEALKPQRKGRRPQLKVKKTRKTDETEQEALIRQLEEENLNLRIENAYLKELRRLRLAQEAQKKQQESSAISEDPSN